MGMIKAGAIAKGTYLLEKNEPFVVNEREFVNPGKGSAFVRLKLKNLRNGAVLKITHKSQDNCEEIDVDEVESQFLYSDGTSYHFMDSSTFDQFEVPMEGFADYKLLMRDGDTYKIIMWEEKPLDIIIPYKVVYKVTEAFEGVKGDTVQGASKLVKIETGLEVKVPIFIKQGERIMINTETREYVERVNN